MSTHKKNKLPAVSPVRTATAARVMQFQAALLKELGPSSDNAKHWRKHIKTIVRETAEVLDLSFLFAVLSDADGAFTIELFWVG
ncbi:MAG TPA: hypothetical protein VIX18_11730, partial [Nitrospirota bacterium]